MNRTKRVLGYEVYQNGQMIEAFEGKTAERKLKQFMRTGAAFDRIIERVRQKNGSITWSFYKTSRNFFE
jgi:hypothetical protein